MKTLETTKHTPGPWKADGTRGSYRNITTTTGECECVAKADLMLTEVEGRWRPDHATTEANARLIAAAPNLLAMCQNALEALEGLKESNACMSDFESACIPALRNAITLATGN